MKKFFLFAILSLNFSTYASDTSEHFTEKELNNSPSAQYVKEMAREFGMSHKAFILAKENFLKYKHEIISPEFPGILDQIEFRYPNSYSETERQRAYNLYQAKFANFFGVPASKLSEFLSSMEAELAPETKQADGSSIVSPLTTDDKYERVSVVCSGVQCGWTSSGHALGLWTEISAKGNNLGLPRGSLFIVDYVEFGQVVNSELWRIYGTSGAHFEREASRPCPTCPFN